MRYGLLFLAACGGSGGGGGDDVPANDAAPPAHSGFIVIQSYDAVSSPGVPSRQGAASAGFFLAGPYCVPLETIGPCKLQQCAMPTGAQSAGEITISGATKPLSLVTDANMHYVQQTSSTPLFVGGETITFTAPGDAVPAFSVSVTTPGKATITSPVEPGIGASLVIPRAQDFSVSWTGGGGGMVQVDLRDNVRSLACRFSASAGTGKVPAAALAKLSASLGSYAMASIGAASKTAGDWGIDATAYFNAVWTDGSIVSGSAMLQ